MGVSNVAAFVPKAVKTVSHGETLAYELIAAEQDYQMLIKTDVDQYTIWTAIERHEKAFWAVVASINR